MRYAVLVGIILIAVPLLLRLNTAEPFPDATSYKGLREAQLGNFDALYGTSYQSSLSDRLFAVIPPQFLLIFLSAATLFIASLLYDKESFMLLLATSPAIISTYTLVGPGALGITCIAIGAYFVLKKQYWALLFIPLCFSLSFSLGILAGIALITIALITGSPFIALSASFVSLLSGIATAFMYPHRSLGLVIPQASELFGVTGTASGVTVFLVFLGVIGFLITWRETRKYSYLLSLAVIPCALFFEHGQILVAAYLAYFGSRAWEALAERNWHFEELQSITLLLIICGILFTTLAVEKQRYTVDQDRVDTTRFIVSAYPPGTSIYASEDIAPILSYHGYSAKSELVLPSGFVTSTLQKEGIALVVTRTDYPPVPNFSLLYQERKNGYRIYEVPHE